MIPRYTSQLLVFAAAASTRESAVASRVHHPITTYSTHVSPILDHPGGNRPNVAIHAGARPRYGNARFHVFADAVAATGTDMVISTEPFSLIPNPNQARFAHYWRTGNDISANWATILNRIDINDKWAPFAGPGHFNDPDMLQVGNGPLTIAEQRSHFGLWAITKATLILGSKVSALSKEQLAIIGNTDAIAINQDPLGIQARKVAINSSVTPHFLGVAPCSMYEAAATYPGTPILTDTANFD